ncbi:MAG: hypothetical protein LBK42_13775 [Propionibacteriaceae bacterium]|jgi:hypothetical protein|nr:hypothetical protein [Propionibacteriaceae bacterium]
MRVTPPDLELWLVGHLRRQLAELDLGRVTVTNKEPADYTAQAPLIVIRNDGGPALPPNQYDWQIGVSVLAGTPADDQPANSLARHTLAILTDPAIAWADQSPITLVAAANGPMRVEDEQPVARRYLTIEYHLVGAW